MEDRRTIERRLGDHRELEEVLLEDVAL